MRRFSFKLERLARVRHVQEEVLRAQWQSAEHRAAKARARTEAGRAAIASALADLRRMQANHQLDPHLILHAREAIAHLEDRLAGLEQLWEVARQEALRLREPWRAVRAELEGLKRLEEKERIKFRIESERGEAKRMDERAQGRFMRFSSAPRRRNASA